MAAPDLYEEPQLEDWEMYELFAVAKWAGVPAWELVQRPAPYYEGYRDAMQVDGMVRNDKMKEVKYAKGI